jgi:hypothetical protein
MTIFSVSEYKVNERAGTITRQRVPPVHDPLYLRPKFVTFNFSGPGQIRLRNQSNGLTLVGHVFVCGTSEGDCFRRLVALLGNWAPDRREFRLVANAFWDYRMKGITPAPGVWILAGHPGKDYPRKFA